MGKRLPQLNSVTQTNPDNYLLIDDSSYDESKKIKLKDIDIFNFDVKNLREETDSKIATAITGFEEKKNKLSTFSANPNPEDYYSALAVNKEIIVLKEDINNIDKKTATKEQLSMAIAGLQDDVDGRFYTIENNLEDFKNEVEDDFSSVEDNFSSMDILQLSERRVYNGWITENGQWGYIDNDFYKFILLPIRGGETLELTSQEVQAGSIACLREEPTIGETLEFSTAEGWGNRRDCRGNNLKYVLPEDGRYLWVSMVFAGNKSEPVQFKINEYDYTISARENVQKIIEANKALSTLVNTLQAKISELSDRFDSFEENTAAIIEDYNIAVDLIGGVE